MLFREKYTSNICNNNLHSAKLNINTWLIGKLFVAIFKTYFLFNSTHKSSFNLMTQSILNAYSTFNTQLTIQYTIHVQ